MLKALIFCQISMLFAQDTKQPFLPYLTTDLLGSFTYIPGTVIHFGYGSLYQKNKWQDNQYVQSDYYLVTKRGLSLQDSDL